MGGVGGLLGLTILFQNVRWCLSWNHQSDVGLHCFFQLCSVVGFGFDLGSQQCVQSS
jgi:hypothetical protein